MRSRALSRVLLVASVVLYLASLTQRVFCLRTGGGIDCGWQGWGVLAFGWLQLIAIGEVGPFVTLPWFANPCLLATWGFVLGSLRRPAVVVAGVGSLLALSFLLGDSVQVSEGGGPSRIIGYGAGYWLWLGSLGLGLLSAVSTPRGRASPGAPAQPLEVVR